MLVSLELQKQAPHCIWQKRLQNISTPWGANDGAKVPQLLIKAL